MALMEVGLDDKYRLDAKRIFLSGTQALVRLPMLQRERDRAAGLNTAGFISGYRGSPLGMYDHALWRAKTFLKEHDIEFAPGLNEDLAATAVWGSQQVGMFPGAKVDGVFGIWYGKGPGVDRSMDALKHANSAGTSPNGGVIALAGDDHGCQSSTLAHQSEQAFAAALMPVVNPATLQDYLDLGILGFALSRYSSCWVGFKAISETVESSASIVSDPDRIKIIMPDDFEMPPGGLSIRWPDAPLDQERRLHGPKMQAVAAFTRANRFDRLVLDSKPARRGIIEDQLLRILYNVDASRRPSVVGKRDETGAMLLPSEGELTPTMVAAAVVARLRRLGHRSPALEQRLAKLEAFDRPAEGVGAAKLQRTPYFCSGCPHNTSTKIPEGSRAMAGIGCHGMALSVPNRRTQTISHMGAEGVSWIGQAPFTSEQHVFQNLGDGTYTHSGLLAVRAAAASGVNIAYKILYNDAVAMTGGQPAEGGLTVSQIAHQVSAEGAKRLVIVSDEPEKYPSNYFPSGATVHHRRELDAVQKELREVKGLTVLIYDQTCAAEKRRRRKRGLYPDPDKRIFINERVCEGCGDCSVVSNCVSVQPLETEFGRKRRIDQSNCNKDFSCIEGFCPSFVTVHGGKLRRADRTAADPSALFADLPVPAVPALNGAYNILVTGIGGTGVITIGALLGMAAHVEGLACSTLDFTGLSQKNGAVMSHVRIAPEADDLATVRIAPGGANLILGCDIVVATSIPALSRAERGVTRAVVNADLLPTASFVIDPDIDFQAGAMRDSLNEAVSASDLDVLDATGLATALMGDSIATNSFMLGFAFQRGAIPLSLEAIMKAIDLNGAAIDMNKLAFSWGRLAAHDLQRVVTAARFKNSGSAPARRTLEESIAFRAKFLTEYQNEVYSKRYLAEVERVRAAEAKGSPGSHDLTEAFAKGLFKLMAYKDEYEVARLYSDGEFGKALKEQFEGDPSVKVSLAPPLLAKRDKVTGHLRKREFGGWILRAFDILTRLKFLRGTALDPFGYTAERRTERALPGEYSAMIFRHLDRAKPQDWPRLALLAKSAELVRGYGHIKEANVAKYRAECARLESAIGQPVAQAAE